MSNIFLISDTHFYHESPYKAFKRDDGTTLRPFANAAEGDAAMIERWNKVVRTQDKVYHLGDITMKRSAESLEILGQLNGEKVLIKGNHDMHKLSQYAQYFKDVRGSHQLAGCILTHIPIHPQSLSRWKANIHGHLHANNVMTAFGTQKDPRYLCVSVEQIDYTPISLEDALKLLNL